MSQSAIHFQVYVCAVYINFNKPNQLTCSHLLTFTLCRRHNNNSASQRSSHNTRLVNTDTIAGGNIRQRPQLLRSKCRVNAGKISYLISKIMFRHFFSIVRQLKAGRNWKFWGNREILGGNDTLQRSWAEFERGMLQLHGAHVSLLSLFYLLSACICSTCCVIYHFAGIGATSF